MADKYSLDHPLVLRTKALVERFGIVAEFVPHEDSGRTTDDAVAALGVPKNNVLKCLLLKKRKRDTYVGCILNGVKRLDIKAVQKSIGVGGLRFANSEQISVFTGHDIGGVPPVALYVCSHVVVDSGVMAEEYVIGSGGTENMGLRMTPDQILRIPNSVVARIADVD